MFVSPSCLHRPKFASRLACLGWHKKSFEKLVRASGRLLGAQQFTAGE